MGRGKVLIYLIRRDLRVADNPVLHHLTTSSDHGYTHLLPLYVFDPLQIEISGFLKNGETSPYPEARSAVGGFWRTGPHRAKFIAQSVWDLKQSLEQLNSGLTLRFGTPVDIIKQVIESMKGKGQTVGGVYMTDEKSSEEKDEQTSIKALCEEQAVDFKLWQDEKYFIDDRDTGLENAKDLPDIFTSYRKMQEPLRERPRTPLTRPEKSKMLPLPEYASDTSDDGPFVVPRTQEDCEARMLEPLKDLMANPPAHPEGVGSAHPFDGGETHGWERIEHLIKSGGMTKYKETRNGLLGPEFSTKLSAYLALGCITARQVHHELIKFEDGRDEKYKSGAGYGQGENDGTRGVRFELLWRDYMRLCTIKFGRRLFHLHGFRQKEKYDRHWKSADKASAPKGQQPSPAEVKDLLQRVLSGTTGLGLIDASQRELYHTGYTSNRARQNVASFLAKHLEIDWRYGAEWYEMLLVDYDVSSNWANWQYVAGVGNDPRGDERQFNPVKQAFDYDKEGSYVRSWVPELKDLERLECVFQVSTAKGWELSNCGLENNIMATNPVKRIQFVPNRKPRPSGKQQWRGGYRGFNRRGGGNGGRGGGGGRGANGGAADGDHSGHQGNEGHESNQTNGNSGAGHDGQNGNHGYNNHGGTQHRGGHGGPTRGGESTRDAFWSGETKSGMADSTSSDDATVQSDYHPQHHQTQPPKSHPGWHGPGPHYPGNQLPDRGSYRGGYGSDRGGYNHGWRQDYPKYWSQPGWTQQPQGIPFPNTYFNGTATLPYDRSFYPSEAPPPIHYQSSHPQPWFMNAQNDVQQPGYHAFNDALPGRGNCMTAGPPMPITYQGIAQPSLHAPPIVQPTSDHLQQKQMSVEARPFVPGQSPEMTNTNTSVVTMMVPAQMGVMQPEPVVVLPPVWGSEGSESGSQDTRHVASQGAPPVIAHGGGAWGLHSTSGNVEAWARA